MNKDEMTVIGFEISLCGGKISLLHDGIKICQKW